MAGKTQTPAAACLTAEQPAALYAIPGGARSGSAWVDYRDAFLGSPAALQIEAIRRGAPAGNLLGAAEALRLPRERVYELVGLSVSTAKRKVAAVTRLLRGESLEVVAREMNVTAAKLSEWRDKVLLGAESALKERERDARDEEIARLKAKVGEITMANELLYSKIDKLEAGRPLIGRRSRK